MISSTKVRTVREIGQIARQRRKDLGWTQQDLATRIGSQKKWVVEFEAGKPTVEASRLLLAINILGLTLTLALPTPSEQSRREANNKTFNNILGLGKSK
ncbi:MAG: helix-turn-helix domain-containing protein [Parvibaculum sp.]